jgi:hypothetical protein
MEGRDRRRAIRYQCSADVRLAWTSNFDTYLAGKCVDISRTGFRILIAHPIPDRTCVSFKSDSLALAGSATVRFCKRQTGKYVIGLNFEGGVAWRSTDPSASESRV